MGQQFSSTILIVDDEDYIRVMASVVLADEGFTVLQASTTAEALDLAEKHDVDVLLTDLHMPGPLDGLQLAAQIRKQNPGVHVVVSSGDDAAAAMDSPSSAVFLPKPYRPHQLADAVRPRTIG